MSVAITGWGVVSSMGNNVEENLQSLKAERTGIAFDEEIDIRKGRFLGRVRLSDEEMSQELG